MSAPVIVPFGAEASLDWLALADALAEGHRRPRARLEDVFLRRGEETVLSRSAWIDGLDNLQTVGRNGMHRYNNQDHSQLTAMLAVKNILGEDHDLWHVNVERSYHEDFTTEERIKRQEQGALQGAAAIPAE